MAFLASLACHFCVASPFAPWDGKQSGNPCSYTNQLRCRQCSAKLTLAHQGASEAWAMPGSILARDDVPMSGGRCRRIMCPFPMGFPTPGHCKNAPRAGPAYGRFLGERFIVWSSFWDLADPGRAARELYRLYGPDALRTAAVCAVTANADGHDEDYRFWFAVFRRLRKSDSLVPQAKLAYRRGKTR